MMAAFALPSLTAAQTALTVIDKVKQILGAVIPILITLAVIYFFWGLGKYILNVDSEEGKEQAKSIMIWGIIALFVMVSVWGLVNLIGNTFDIQSGNSIQLPTVPGVSGQY